MRARIVTLPGDGIGPEVVREGVRVLRTVGERWGHTFELSEAAIGGAAIDATSNPLPQETVTACQSADAVLLGAVGGLKWDDPRAAVRPEQGLLGLRKSLGVFANLRPVAVHPRLAAISPVREELLRGVDLLVVRELTGGIYFGARSRRRVNGGEEASDVCTYTSEEIARVVRVAARLASERRGVLTSVDKANVLETSRLWRSVTTEVIRDEFPALKLSHMLVDACAMHLIRRPAEFDVIVTENMFGDILTDEASMLAGSIGALPSASLGEAPDARASGRQTRLGVYEPIHGSAPDIVGKGIANPIGTILSVAMLLRHSLGLIDEATAVERAVRETIDSGVVTVDLAAPGATSSSTHEVGESIATRLAGRGQLAGARPGGRG